MKRIALVSLVLIQAAFLCSCNTMAGAGKDISQAGHAISGAANSR